MKEIRIAYWKNGKRWSEAPYLNGELCGLYKNWHSDGSICFQSPVVKHIFIHGLEVLFKY